jgi:hypothetical protein
MAEGRVVQHTIGLGLGDGRVIYRPGDTIPEGVIKEYEIGDHVFEPPNFVYRDPTDVVLEDMKVPELVKMAKNLNIDLAGSNKKAEIIQAIRAKDE